MIARRHTSATVESAPSADADRDPGRKLLEDAEHMSPENQAYVREAVVAWRSMEPHELDELDVLI
ncbi:MAG: hypothetical protein IRZ32_03125 [Solirubrobacteraceae bacterium]|nr:hypothetical protein [Solirubrobacteraceae bacterium]